MKRLLGTIGITYLSVLAVVFYFANDILLLILIGVSAIALLLGIFFKAIKNKVALTKSTSDYLTVIGGTALCACLAIFLYSNYIYSPVIDNYSGKEINIKGYICEEVQIRQGSSVYIISADEANGRRVNLKISLTSTVDLNAEDFDRITARIYTEQTDSGSLLADGIFLTSFYDEETSSLTPTGEKQFSPYAFAVCVRKAMKHSLNVMLPESSSALCKAVLLGDKQALSYDARDDFTKTGTSFLIVVSGMHLSIITGFILFLLKKIIKNRIVLCTAACASVLSFMAVTGFSPSVTRSGVMVILTYCGSAVFRRTDSINSLGAAALGLILLNPYAVGDIGMILSFAATAGIILWAPKIYAYICRKLHLKHKIPKFVLNMFAVSVSASLWIMPITTAAFGRISPFVVFASLLTEPIVSVVLICSMLAAVLYICPFISAAAYPFALVCAVLGKLFLKIISLFASIPYCSVKSDKLYFYVWIILTAALVAVGYAIKARGFYIRCSAAVSAVTLAAGWAIFSLTGYNTAVLKVYDVGNGVTASIECGSNISFISCGGSKNSCYDIINSVSGDFSSIDCIIIPDAKLKYSRYLPQLISEFDVSNILVYDKDTKNQKMLESYDGSSRNTFGGNCRFTVSLNPDTSAEIINIDSVTYQYINFKDETLLFVPSNGDISLLPEKYRKCDCLLIDSAVKNTELLNCKNVIFSGEDLLNDEKYNSIKEITNNIYTISDGKAEFVFCGG